MATWTENQDKPPHEVREIGEVRGEALQCCQDFSRLQSGVFPQCRHDTRRWRYRDLIIKIHMKSDEI